MAVPTIDVGCDRTGEPEFVDCDLSRIGRGVGGGGVGEGERARVGEECGSTCGRLGVEPEFDDGDGFGLDRLATLRGRRIFVLLQCIDSGIAKGFRAGKNVDFADMAGSFDGDFGFDVAGDVTAHGVWRIDGISGFKKFWFDERSISGS